MEGGCSNVAAVTEVDWKEANACVTYKHTLATANAGGAFLLNGE